jgi:hemerythrin superfamily protein
MDDERNIQRDLAMLAGGLALGLLASRLTPLAASARGSLQQARTGGDPFDKLLKDHRLIQSTLEQMERSGDASTVIKMKQFLILKRTLGKHALAEEDVVYPILHDRAGDQDKSMELYAEHADMKIHLHELENMIRSGQDWTERVRSLRQLIDEHIADEEEEQFPKLRRMMDEEKQRKVAGQIRREEALVL